MNDYRNQPQFDIDDLETFERKLRSMTPREAAFQLPVTNSNESLVAEMHSADSRSRNKNKVWVATLVATWSMGAAAGIAGTLFYSSFGTASVRSDIAAAPDSKHNSTSSAVVNANDVELQSNETRRDELQAGVPSTNSSLLTSWSFLLKRHNRSTSAQSTLTPRSFAADLAFDSPIPITKIPLEEQNLGPSAMPEAVLTAPPDKIQLPTPTNQRDLMRNLLQI